MRIVGARAVRTLYRFATSMVPARAATPARTTTYGIALRLRAPLYHLGGFRSHPLLAHHAPGDPVFDRAYVDVRHPNPAC